MKYQDWTPGDASWLKQRKEEWRYIKANLRQIREQLIPELEAYFLSGVYESWLGTAPNRFYRLWFWPERSEPAWRKVLTGADAEAFEGLRDRLAPAWSATTYAPPYGFMGGR